MMRGVSPSAFLRELVPQCLTLRQVYVDSAGMLLPCPLLEALLSCSQVAHSTKTQKQSPSAVARVSWDLCVCSSYTRLLVPWMELWTVTGGMCRELPPAMRHRLTSPSEA